MDSRSPYVEIHDLTCGGKPAGFVIFASCCRGGRHNGRSHVSVEAAVADLNERLALAVAHGNPCDCEAVLAVERKIYAAELEVERSHNEGTEAEQRAALAALAALTALTAKPP